MPANTELSIQKILVPVDFSERSLGILTYVRAFALRYEAEAILLHVVNPVYSIPPTGPLAAAPVPLPEFTIEEANEQLEKFGAAELTGIAVRRLAYEGSPLEQIVACAQSEDVQIIMMPTHGYGRLGRFLFGSITEDVRHDLKCPVFTGVHMEQHAHEESAAFRRICLVGSTKAAEEWAAKLAADFGAEFEPIGLGELRELTGTDLLVIGKEEDEVLIRHVSCPVVSV